MVHAAQKYLVKHVVTKCKNVIGLKAPLRAYLEVNPYKAFQVLIARFCLGDYTEFNLPHGDLQ